MSVSDVDKYIIRELKTPFSAEVNPEYSKSAARIMWLNKNVVPGSFKMSFSCYLKPDLKDLPVHTHETVEIPGFFGNNPDGPYNPYGEIELVARRLKFYHQKDHAGCVLCRRGEDKIYNCD